MLSFSIITCAWNSEPYISQCIASVHHQTYPQVEQIFVDGGSEDGTLERIKAVIRPSRWVTGIRGGISDAMNVGVEMAKGDVIAHLHSDDYYLGPDVLANVAAEMERTGALWLFGRIVSDIDGQLVMPGWTMPAVTWAQLLRGNFIAHPAVFIRKDFYVRTGGFDKSLRYAMDYDLWLRLMRLAPPSYLDQNLAAFRRHVGSISTTNAIEAFKEDHAVRKRYIEGGIINSCFHEVIYLRRLVRHRMRLRG